MQALCFEEWDYFLPAVGIGNDIASAADLMVRSGMIFSVALKVIRRAALSASSDVLRQIAE